MCLKLRQIETNVRLRQICSLNLRRSTVCSNVNPWLLLVLSGTKAVNVLTYVLISKAYTNEKIL